MIKPMLAKKYNNQDVTGWLMSEKLDGVRCIYDGEKFYSRNGKIFHAPDWFYTTLPKGVVLDGELYQGLGQFQKTCGIVRRYNDNWDNVKFMVFDLVNDNMTFESRIEYLKYMINDLAGHFQLVPHQVCNGVSSLARYEKKLRGYGAEGVMIKNPKSMYQYKRSSDLLKLKQFINDECKLVDFQDGQGKHTDKVGALICEWKGHTIKLGTGITDRLRENPPKIGAFLTFSYFELTDKGVPRFPAFVEVRDYE